MKEEQMGFGSTAFRFRKRSSSRISNERYGNKAFAIPAMLLFTLCVISLNIIATLKTAIASEYSVKAPLAVQSLLLDGISMNGLMVVVGERGHILSSRDNGQTWQQGNVPTRATLTGVYFHDQNLGWAVGHDAAILRTKDGGLNWDLTYSAPEEEKPLLDVWFKDAQNGFAIGAYGYFLVTEDSGNTWVPRAISEDDFHLNHISRSKTGRLYIAAEAGNLYRSDDEGRTWASLPSPYGGSFFGTLPLEGDTLLLFGLRGNLFRSEDAGQTWQKLETNTEALLSDGLIRPDGSVVVVGQAGAVLVSKDGGHRFELRQLPDREAISAAICSSNGHLILIGENGVTGLP